MQSIGIKDLNNLISKDQMCVIKLKRRTDVYLGYYWQPVKKLYLQNCMVQNSNRN